MNKIYLAMADIETVDRAFSTKEKARAYVRGWMTNQIYYKKNPALLTDAVIDSQINECDFDSVLPV
jgi:hypothetical protein